MIRMNNNLEAIIIDSYYTLSISNLRAKEKKIRLIKEKIKKVKNEKGSNKNRKMNKDGKTYERGEEQVKEE